MKNNQCQFDCGRDVKYPTLGLCHACYQTLRMAGIRGVKWSFQRREKLELYARRIEAVIGQSNVRRLKRKRA